MARSKVSKIKSTGNGSPYWNHVEAHGGIEAMSMAVDAESARQWQAEQALEGTDEAIQLEAILDTFNSGGLTNLTPMQQKVFQLCVVEGMTQETAAAQLRISQQMTEKHLSRACKTLEELAEKRVKQVVVKNTKWTKEMIREVAKKFPKK